MLDSLHHAACVCCKKNSGAAAELVQTHNLKTSIRFQDGLRALLEVLPLTSPDFIALEKLRRLEFLNRIEKPRQLRLWKEGAGGWAGELCAVNDVFITV